MASPVSAGGLIFVPDTAGRTCVFRAGPKFELLAENDLANGGFATPSVCGSTLFLRTSNWLFCVQYSVPSQDE
jgi:hypothetical protein